MTASPKESPSWNRRDILQIADAATRADYDEFGVVHYPANRGIVDKSKLALHKFITRSAGLDPKILDPAAIHIRNTLVKDGAYSVELHVENGIDDQSHQQLYMRGVQREAGEEKELWREDLLAPITDLVESSHSFAIIENYVRTRA